MLSNKSAVIQHVEPTNLFDVPTDHSHITIDSNDEARSLWRIDNNKPPSALTWFLSQKRSPPTALSAINVTQMLFVLQSELQLLNSIDKLQASIVRLNVVSSQNSNNLTRSKSRPQFDRSANRSAYFNLPPRCFYCNITGHVQRECRKRRNDMARRRNFSNFNQNNFHRRVTYQDQRPPFRGGPQNRGFSGCNDNRQFNGGRNGSPNRCNFSPLNQRNFNNNQFARNNDSAIPREN
jgi:hypothetical protein